MTKGEPLPREDPRLRALVEEMLRRQDEIQATLRDIRDALRDLAPGGSSGPVTRAALGGHHFDRGRYQALIVRIRELVRSSVPPEATVLAISRGDTALLNLEGRTAWHFPQNEHGVYAGHYPADSTAAITHLEAQRARGADFLLVPATAFWWLRHYREFKRHLDHRYQVVAEDEEACLIYALRPPDRAREPLPGRDQGAGYRALVRQIREVVNSLLPPHVTVLVISRGDDALLELDGRRTWHFPQNADGVYAGFHPADGAAAVAHLEALRARGADFLLVPRSADWWLTHYVAFAKHLERHYRLVVRQAHVCTIYALEAPRSPEGAPA